VRHRPLPPPTLTFTENYDELVSSWQSPKVRDLFSRAFSAPIEHVEDRPDCVVVKAEIFGSPVIVHLVAIKASLSTDRVYLLFSSDVDKAAPGWQDPTFPGPGFVLLYDITTERVRFYNYKPLHLAFYNNVSKWLEAYGRVIAEIRMGETVIRRLAFIPVVQRTFTKEFMVAAGRAFPDLKTATVDGAALIDIEDLERPL